MTVIYRCPLCGAEKEVRNQYDANKLKSCMACVPIRFRRAALERREKLRQPKEYKLIPLAGGYQAKVSNADFGELSMLAWHTILGEYALDRNGVRMHRMVMGSLVGDIGIAVVDHINGDTLDNRRENLRLASLEQNARNRRLNQNNKSGYKGVKLYRSGRWASFIRTDGKQYHVGYFDTAEEAAWMRDQWALELHGEFARLNFDYL